MGVEAISYQELENERDQLAIDLQEAEKERDELKALLGSATLAHAETIKRERVLAAHVERIQERARLITDRRQWEGDADPRVPHVLLDKLSDACMEAPTTSLARLKAECQADAIENLHKELSGYFVCQDMLDCVLGSAVQYRQQAEGGE